MDAIGQFQHYSKYARFDVAAGRREHWPETVDRTVGFFVANRPALADVADDLRAAMFSEGAMPSMRSVQMAGPPAERCNVSLYNCAYSPIEDTKDMADALYILMQGTGFAFSVERAFIGKLPVVAPATDGHVAITVEDNTESWCDALHAVLDAAYAGHTYDMDVSAVRPAGARLVTKGGYASGPEPLVELCTLAYDTLRAAVGRRLRPFEVHRIMCKIGQIVQVGGVRRAAMLSLSDIDDIEMRECKNGAFWERYPELTMANNSAAYRTADAWGSFDDEWANLVSGGSGERGIFNGQSPQPARRRVSSRTLGTNPCGEINLVPRQFCNLSIAIMRPDDTLDDIRRKVVAAAIFGTAQASFTDFRYIKGDWSANSQREALLGVDLQGALDNDLLQDPATLSALRQLVLETNQVWAERLRINRTAAATCIKPSGNSGERFGTGNSLTGWYAPFFERRVVIQKSEPLYAFLVAQGVPVEEHYSDPRLAIFVFPKRAPAGAVIRGSRTALEQLEWWLTLKRHWTEHNPSATIYVRADEWDAVAGWIRENREWIGGLSFLGFDDTVYPQAPYTPITEGEYNAAVARFPDVDWTLLDAYERGVDSTTAGQEFACLGDSCSIG